MEENCACSMSNCSSDMSDISVSTFSPETRKKGLYDEDNSFVTTTNSLASSNNTFNSFSMCSTDDDSLYDESGCGLFPPFCVCTFNVYK